MVIPIRLSECNNLDDFNRFLKKNDIKIVAGAAFGRKFQIAGKKYTMNQILAKFSVCMQKSGGLVQQTSYKKAYIRIQTLQELGCEKIAADRKEGKLSKTGHVIIKIRQALGNFLPKLVGFDKERVLNLVRKDLISQNILTQPQIDEALKTEKEDVSKRIEKGQILRDVKKLLKDTFDTPFEKIFFSDLNVKEIEGLTKILTMYQNLGVMQRGKLHLGKDETVWQVFNEIQQEIDQATKLGKTIQQGQFAGQILRDVKKLLRDIFDEKIKEDFLFQLNADQIGRLKKNLTAIKKLLKDNRRDKLHLGENQKERIWQILADPNTRLHRDFKIKKDTEGRTILDF